LTVRKTLAQMPVMQGIFHFARRLAFAALVVRALVPTGWMPDAAGLVMCSVDMPMQHENASIPMDHDAMSMAMDHDDMMMDRAKTDASHGKNEPAQYSHHDICPFAAAPHLASIPELPQLTLPALHTFAAATDQLYALAIGARFAPQSPRAPPQTV
jgi:hypothetical protein